MNSSTIGYSVYRTDRYVYLRYGMPQLQERPMLADQHETILN